MNNLINFYAKSGYISHAHLVFDEMPERTIFSWNTLLSAYAKQGLISQACGVFNKIPTRDSVSWTTMIVGYNQMGRFASAMRVFAEMIRDGIEPTEYTITSMLASCAAIEDLGIGRKDGV